MLKVLIAEDDLMIADMTEEVLIENGYEVCGIARTVSDAVALGLLHRPDLAILDLRLADNGLGTEIAARLSELHGLGVLYATANAGHVVLTATDGTACLSKPYRSVDLVHSLQIVSNLVATGKAMQPLPRGFQVLNPHARARTERFHA